MRVLSPCLTFDCGLLRTHLGDDVAVGLPIELIVELKSQVVAMKNGWQHCY